MGRSRRRRRAAGCRSLDAIAPRGGKQPPSRSPLAALPKGHILTTVVEPHPPAPFPTREGGEDRFLLPLSCQERGLGGEVKLWTCDGNSLSHHAPRRVRRYRHGGDRSL